MDKQQISQIQLFVTMVSFQLGSAVILGIGMDAKQDAWIAILFAMVAGLGLFSIYGYLAREYPQKTMFDCIESIIGKFGAKIISLLYAAYFIYIAARVLRDFGDLVLTTVLPETPLLAVNILMSLVILYAFRLGVEVIVRFAEILFPYVFIGLLLFFIFIFAGGLPDWTNLQPVLENGWKPVFSAAFPNILTFPFGETIVFWVIMAHIKNCKKVIPIGLLSILTAGLFLTLVNIINIAVLGTYHAKTHLFPFLETIEKVNIAEVFQRLDPIALTIFIVGGYLKITILFTAGMIGLQYVFSKKYSKFLTALVGALLVISSIYMSENFTEHLTVGLEIVPRFLHIPMQVIFPILLLITHLIKKRFKKGDHQAMRLQ